MKKLFFVWMLFALGEYAFAQSGVTKYGNWAGDNNSTGNYNTFFGERAGYVCTTTSYNTYIGYNAGRNSSGASNTEIGYQAGYDGDGNYNTFMGMQAGYNTDGNYNSFLGFKAGFGNDSGVHNTFLGDRAGYGNTTDSYNVFVGSQAGVYNKGTYCTIVGRQTGMDNEGDSNVLIGSWAGYNNTTGAQNVYFGNNAGYANSTGSQNLFLGHRAGYSNTGSSSVSIGYNAGSNETGSYKLYMDNSDTSSPLIYGDLASDSLQINGDLYVPSGYDIIAQNRFALSGGGAKGEYGASSGEYPLRVFESWGWNFTLGNDSISAFRVGPSSATDTTNMTYFVVRDGGNVGIGMTDPSKKLEVNGTIKATELMADVIATNTDANNVVATSVTTSELDAGTLVLGIGTFPDYVFSPPYQGMPLEDLETYIQTHQKLPDMPSEKEVITQGL